MVAKNACDGIQGNPQLKGSINALVRSYYNRYRNLMIDSAYDLDDLFQELMLELCEEPVKTQDSHYQRLCTDRLKDIVDKLARVLNDDNGRVVFTPIEDEVDL